VAFYLLQAEAGDKYQIIATKSKLQASTNNLLPQILKNKHGNPEKFNESQTVNISVQIFQITQTIHLDRNAV